tara:strand:- start:1225 stop:1461 length:237 start_codon:yes stop_codon:yes gene_type:complete
MTNVEKKVKKIAKIGSKDFSIVEQLRHANKIISDMYTRNKDKRQRITEEEMDYMLSYLNYSRNMFSKPKKKLIKFTRN